MYSVFQNKSADLGSVAGTVGLGNVGIVFHTNSSGTSNPILVLNYTFFQKPFFVD